MKAEAWLAWKKQKGTDLLPPIPGFFRPLHGGRGAKGPPCYPLVPPVAGQKVTVIVGEGKKGLLKHKKREIKIKNKQGALSGAHDIHVTN